ncbi:MXAN_6230/SCO0854 family RING domain-containing protein [Massilia rubra]|uniref:RING-type domain-containing protein n=1 Tax=Massilia rubra TaxID=2607910 RepID=A0ABX0LQV8_9BURK|nr:MXAN_6230/SCO0854 family RING domain-containing protein [Massilia rubra]NHZ35103.1 hypothetical protein [Massilia rubra]
MLPDFSATHAILLRRRLTLFIPAGAGQLPDTLLQAFDLNLAELGYVASQRLRARLGTLDAQGLTDAQAWMWDILATEVGGHRQHTPLFRRFPDDVPSDTGALWVRKVLTHFMQAEGQPCLHCGQCNTTHVLKPCRHVVCDACFDGSSYSACPVCEHHVDRTSPFFTPDEALPLPAERVRLKLLDLADDLDGAVRALVLSMCERKQVMSPVDTDDFKSLISDYGLDVLAWIPGCIPVRENIALLFGTLLQGCAPGAVMAAAAAHIDTATDVIRLIAAYSGVSPSLQGFIKYKSVATEQLSGFKRFAEVATWGTTIMLQTHVKRFKVAKLGRPLRRELLGLLERLPLNSLVEDMLRHQSYWVWVGQFLHPHEYQQRYPQVAFAFSVIRKKGADGTPGPAFETYYTRLEKAVMRKDAIGMVDLLRQRPGELARRFDHALRVADGDSAATEQLLAAFERCVAQFSTPVLLTLRALLPTRARAGATRMFWPAGTVATGIMAPDRRGALPQPVIEQSLTLIERALLARFSAKPHVSDFLIDRALADIIVPFNERTASRSAVQLPRGSTLAVPDGKKARLFLHWCEPPEGGAYSNTDLDLAIGFYDEHWNLIGECSYRDLTWLGRDGETVAVSSGDLRDAPFPDGATEFVDLDCALARSNGVRYAVMEINSFCGMPFEALEHAFAGLMFRDDMQGAHMDPRTVALRFNLQGEHGTFMPLVFDLQQNRLHWLEVYAEDGFDYNNVETANTAVRVICPAMIAYFASGVRTNMAELALLHAAARAQRVILRGDGMQAMARRDGEDDASFLARLRAWNANEVDAVTSLPQQPLFAALLDADITLPENSVVYALRPGVTATTIAASDLIS